ncbi:MAG: VCBS repeat-containing protein, partial [Planctomycetaceae bacterium]|nr:VCBS repeat-containing protein [Planctomycetaceae bacterium]
MVSFRALSFVACIFSISFLHADERGTPWQRHAVESGRGGADGVRLQDVNGDQLLDITTGWEEGKRIRVYLHPGSKKVKSEWPGVTVGQVTSPEDAVFADVDGDGAVDVVSSCEGKERTVFIHWAPPDKKEYLNPAAWQTEAIPVSEKAKSWMFCLPMQVDGQHGVDLVAGAKGGNAGVGWFESPANPRNLHLWKWNAIYKAGWIMT